MFQEAWTVYIISQFIWITNMRQPLLFVPGTYFETVNTFTARVGQNVLALRASVFKRILNSFFYTKQNTNIGRFPFDQNVRKCGNGCKWWENFKGKSENWWISRIRTIQPKILEIPRAKLKRKKTSGRKFGYTSLGCPLFRKFGKCCGRKESGHSFFFSNQQSVQRMRNISEKWHTTTV